MNESIIKVENLGKKYSLSHVQSGSYFNFREMITDNAKKLVNPMKWFAPRPKNEEFWALKDVNFEVKQGERVGIIGRNGAGKSTLLKILSRITDPTEGKITINGRVASLLEVGTGFHPELTGRENIYLNGAILGMTRREIKRKFSQIVEFAEVEKFLDTPVKRYSSGMYVRLAFAVAAHLDPEILIIDEVLAVGDAAFQKKCLGKMDEVSRGEGRTVLFVSHNMGMIRQLCNKCIYLDKGTIKENDLVNKVVNSYEKDILTIQKFTPKQKFDIARINDFDIDFKINNGKRLTKFIMSIESKKDFNAFTAIGIDNPYSGRILTLYSQFHHQEMKIKKGVNTVICEVEDLPVKPGSYQISLLLRDFAENYDYVDKAINIDIPKYDIIDYKTFPEETQGVMVINNKWYLN